MEKVELKAESALGFTRGLVLQACKLVVVVASLAIFIVPRPPALFSSACSSLLLRSSLSSPFHSSLWFSVEELYSDGGSGGCQHPGDAAGREEAARRSRRSAHQPQGQGPGWRRGVLQDQEHRHFAQAHECLLRPSVCGPFIDRVPV